MSFMDRLEIYSTNNDIRLLNSMNEKCHWNVIIGTWVVVGWKVFFLRMHRNLCRTGAPLASVFFASLVFRGNPARFISPFTFVSRHLTFTHLRRVSFRLQLPRGTSSNYSAIHHFPYPECKTLLTGHLLLTDYHLPIKNSMQR